MFEYIDLFYISKAEKYTKVKIMEKTGDEVDIWSFEYAGSGVSEKYDIVPFSLLEDKNVIFLGNNLQPTNFKKN